MQRLRKNVCHLWENCKWLWKRTLSNCYTLIWPSRNWPEAGLRSGAYSPADMWCATQLNLSNHTNTELSWVALITGCTMAWAGKVTDCYPEKERIGQGCGLIDLYHLSGPLYLSAWAGIQTLSRHSGSQDGLQSSHTSSKGPLLTSCPISDSPLLTKGQRCSLCRLSPNPGNEWSLLNTWEVSDEHYCT